MSSGDAEGSPDWATPPEFFLTLAHKFGPFVLDAAATARNTKCERYYSSVQDSLVQDWKGWYNGPVFCNPPYGRGIGAWVQKGADEADKWGNRVVMLLPARTDTKWFHDIIMPRAAAVYFVRGRLRFTKPRQEKKNSATFPSIVVVFQKGYSDVEIPGGHFGVI
jgi:site-specific DNA-methyltransferase (adenine-specific)